MFLDFSIYTPTYISLTWALILILSSRENRARYMLGLFMLAVAMIFISHVVYFHRLKSSFVPFDLLFVFGSLSIFPLYYLYIKLLTVKSQINYSDLKHFIPAVVMLLAVALVYMLMTPELRKLYVYNYLYGIGTLKNAPLLIQIQSGLLYLLQILYFLQILLSYVKIKKYVSEYNEQIANFYSNLENKTLEWPKIILYTFAISSVFTIITNFLGRSFFDKSPVLLLITCASYGLFLFVLGYLGYLQNHTVKNFETDSTAFSECENTSFSNPVLIATSANKKFKAQLRKLFEEDNIYKNPELKISDVAEKLKSNRSYISAFINSEYGCSFSTFVNRYRVEAAETALTDTENNNFSLEHIASLVGFGSLHSFIRVFKEIKGTTPGKFREENIVTKMQ